MSEEKRKNRKKEKENKKKGAPKFSIHLQSHQLDRFETA